MSKTLQQKMNELPEKRRQQINRRHDDLVAEEMTLADLRKALQLTQTDLSTKLHMKQEAISRLERRSDLLLSTLEDYIQAMGGQLRITAEFPDRPSVQVKKLGDIQPSNNRQTE
jgi:DNA-binding transcriptional regulator YiaG